MKIELIGTWYPNGRLFDRRPHCVWSLWMNEDYVIKSGTSASKAKAEIAATKAFEAFKRDINHRRKSIRFQE